MILGKESHYWERVRQGAIIVPSVLLCIDPEDPNSTYQPRRAKAPWKKLPVFDITDIPSDWRISYAASKNLKPFELCEPLAQAIIPQSKPGTLLKNKEAREISEVWRKLDDAYQHDKGIGPRTPEDLIAQINFSGKWSSQFPLQTSVIYNASGQILRAAVAECAIDSTLYRIPCYSLPAAYYLCAMLNSESLRSLYAMARGSDRHFHKTPLSKIPIPQYDESNKKHKRLSELSRLLHEKGPGNAKRLKNVSRLAGEIILQANKGFADFIKK